jgi:hypothetical protein
MIAARAGLKKVPWDGYLKHNRPSPKHTEEKCVQSLSFSHENRGVDLVNLAC